MPQQPEFKDFPDQPGGDFPDLSDFPDQLEPEKGLLQRAWERSIAPITTRPSIYMRQVSELMNPERETRGLKGISSAYIEALGDVVSGLSSPWNIALTSTGLGALGAARFGLPRVAGAFTAGTRALSTPVAIGGVKHIYEAENLPEQLMGGLETGMGILGMRAKVPTFKPKIEGKPPTIEPPPSPPPGPVSPDFKPRWVVVKKPTAAIVAKLKQEGYEPAGVNSEGFIKMVRGDLIKSKVTEEAPKIQAVEPQNTRQLIMSIPKTGNIEFDNMVSQLRNWEGILTTRGLTDAELDTWGNLVDAVRKHPSMPPKLNNLWSEIGRRQRERGQEFKAGQLVRIRQPTVATARPTLVERHPAFKEGQIPASQREFSIKNPSKGTINSLRKRGYEISAIEGEKVKFRRASQVEREKQISDIFEEPQEMRVPGPEGNVAIGGGSPRVLQVLGSSLYTQDRPSVITKELLQNAFDEHRIIGQKEEIRVLFEYKVPNPRTNESSVAITVADRGRGMMKDEIYTKLTDVGESGKLEEESASGGFGFAKAAPFLGGKYTKVESIVYEGGKKHKYTFEGTPEELINQARGVPLKDEIVGPEVETGLRITTYLDEAEHNLYGAQDIVKNMAGLSPGVTSPVHMKIMVHPSTAIEGAKRDFLSYSTDPQYQNFGEAGLYEKRIPPPIQGKTSTPGADIEIMYDTPVAGIEQAGYELHTLNKGMWQGASYGYYGSTFPNVPGEVIANVIAKVKPGTKHYPFGANREQVDRAITNAIVDWIDANVKTGALRTKLSDIQVQYDGIKPFGSSKLMSYDPKNKFTPEEISTISNSPEFGNAFSVVERVANDLISIADDLRWDPKPSTRLKKFGILFDEPRATGVTLGIHIPNPSSTDSAMLINVMELLNISNRLRDPLDRLATAFYATLTHEIAHIPGGPHDKGFAYRHAALLEVMGRAQTNIILEDLAKAFGEVESGRINPKIQELLSIYNQSRRRAPSGQDLLMATGVSIKRPTNIAGRTQIDGGGIGASKKAGWVRELYNLSRGLTTSWDLSAPLRQGLPLITRKEWWTSWDDMIRARGSEEAYQAVMGEIRKKPIFQRKIDLNTGKEIPSFAEEIGMELTDLRELSTREELLMSKWAEKVPGVRKSNRAYTAFLNKLRADTLESLLNQARDMGLNPYSDLNLARQIVDFVNTASGRGPLKTALPTIGRRGIHFKEFGVERYTTLLTNTLFSPRLSASRVRMLNPGTYIMAHPFVRKQYFKAMKAAVGTWLTIAGLSKMAGADVVLDTNSSDFGKIKIGNTRLDPAGGFQQYLVAFSRLATGKYTSSTTGREFELGRGYRATTRKDVMEQFVANKLHPVLKFAYDMYTASEYKPFSLYDRTLQMFIPLIVQDAIELAKEDPSLLPLIAPVAIGMGTQTYEKGGAQEKFIPPEMDIQFPLEKRY